MTQIGRMAGSIWQPAPRSIYQQSWSQGLLLRRTRRWDQ